jgi:hypothetical protein
MGVTFRELIKAVLNGDVDNLRQYLEDGLDADSCGENKMTALMMAAKKGNLEIVKMLLNYGANPKLVSLEGFTALNYANDKLVCEALLRAGGRYESVIPIHWLKERISFTDLDHLCAEAKEDWKVEKLEPFKTLLLPEHELWTFASPPETWQSLAGRAGFAIVYEYMPVRALVTMLN